MSQRALTRWLAAALLLCGASTFVTLNRSDAAAQNADATTAQRTVESKAAFHEVYKVLMHPRCLNCHPAGDRPLQGDDSHVHAQNVQRGSDGGGKFALKCKNCHQDTNLPGAGLPPGNPVWHLPKPEMPLVFEGLSPAELATQLKDPKKNGGKSLEQLFHHIDQDQLVLWGWNPGEGRTLPPLSHADFSKKFREWLDKGAAIPD